ncbi:MAG: aspartate/glutamate racemase family protein [Candidatus Woesearchaeota archaeon]
MKVGVLGGIGPEATGTFYLKLIAKLQQEGLIQSNKDYPQIIINSIPAKELVGTEVGKEDLLLYRKALNELDKHDPDFIVMVCNTIHLYHEELQSGIKSELVDLREEVKSALERLGIENIAVMGTPSTVSNGLYEFHGFRYFNPTLTQLDELGKAVYNYNRGQDKERQVLTAERIAMDCIARGAQSLLLACTEFSLMLSGRGLPAFDTIDELVSAVVRRYLAMR